MRSIKIDVCDDDLRSRAGWGWFYIKLRINICQYDNYELNPIKGLNNVIIQTEKHLSL